MKDIVINLMIILDLSKIDPHKKANKKSALNLIYNRCSKCKKKQCEKCKAPKNIESLKKFIESC